MAVTTEQLFPLSVATFPNPGSAPVIVGANPWDNPVDESTYVEFTKHFFVPSRNDQVLAMLPAPVDDVKENVLGLRLRFRAEVFSYETNPPLMQIQLFRVPHGLSEDMYLSPEVAPTLPYPWYPLDTAEMTDYILEISAYVDTFLGGENSHTKAEWLTWLYAGQVGFYVKPSGWYDFDASDQVTRIYAMWLEVDYDRPNRIAPNRRQWPAQHTRIWPPITSPQVSTRGGSAAPL